MMTLPFRHLNSSDFATFPLSPPPQIGYQARTHQPLPTQKEVYSLQYMHTAPPFSSLGSLHARLEGCMQREVVHRKH
jgi:hypothetical protein